MTAKRPSAAGPKGEQKRAAEERERAGARHTSHEKSKFLRGELFYDAMTLLVQLGVVQPPA